MTEIQKGELLDAETAAQVRRACREAASKLEKVLQRMLERDKEGSKSADELMQMSIQSVCAAEAAAKLEKALPTLWQPTRHQKVLQTFDQKIVEEGQPLLQDIDTVRQALYPLKMLKYKGSQNPLPVPPPPEFICPLSQKLMKDPVILISGQTYDRLFIERWLEDGEITCPVSKQVLSDRILTPNLLIKDMIATWCKDHGIVSTYDDDMMMITNAEGDSLKHETLCKDRGIASET